ncbi:pentatricopeptide repeat-containing protein At3g22670, mitochondrial-like [Humulus lupulus]|uniref:pentatricopeptide repeat-containing protein At3g22670, mitochondrial-like n=1 Tax=Humulus lupulus TaxID=3486 RepID=UPI002B40D5D7|nr:pentatricopeptide repeat-containing protein At3g22670, mitochondrial-like [Humulus lupulus]
MQHLPPPAQWRLGRSTINAASYSVTVATLFSIPKPTTIALHRYLLFNSQCTKTESPQEEDDDFVIPSLVYWVESPNQRLVELEPRKQLRQSLYDTAERILNRRFSSPEQVNQALNDCGLTLSDSIVHQFLMRFSNEWVLAFDFFIWAETQTDYRHSPESYNLMVDILGKARKFQLLWGLIEEMNRLDGYFSLVTMTKVIGRLAGARLYKEAIDVLRGIERFGISKDITSLNILMDSLVKRNGVKHAHEVFLEFKDSIPM